MPGIGQKVAQAVCSRALPRDVLLPLWVGAMYVKSRLLVCMAVSKTGADIHWHAARTYGAHTLVYWSFAILAVAPALLLRGRARLGYYLASSLALALLFLGDIVHLRGMGAFVSVHDLSQVGNLQNLQDSIVSLLRPVDLVLVADLPILAAVAWWRRRDYAARGRAPVAFALLAAVASAHLGYVHWKLDVANKGGKSTLFTRTFFPPETISRLGPIGFHGFDLFSYLRESRTRELSPAEIGQIEAWFDQKREEGLPDDPPRGALSGKSLLLLQVEALETFPLGNVVEGQEITPNLNKLLPEALFFTDLHDQVFIGASSDADLMHNTGLYPVRQGATFHRFPDNRYPSLPKLLGDRGYATVAMHADRAGLWNWAQGLRGVGFAQTLDQGSFAEQDTLFLGLSDEAYLRQVRPVLTAMRRPFYAFVVTLSSHAPFELAAERGPLKLSPELAASRMGKYFRALSYTDAQIGKLLDGLREDGVLDETAVAVVGDHGGVHKYYCDEVEAMPRQEPWWKDDDSHVPLLVWSKGLAGRRVRVKGGQVDVMPTLLYLLGVDEVLWQRSTMGRNLLQTRHGFAVLANGRFVGGPAERQEHAARGLEIADWIITGRYFERYRRRTPSVPEASRR